MNQEQNNMNQNNFDSQGNNGIPNNQPLTNQIPNININNNQVSQTTNTIGDASINNQEFNGKTPKKMNMGLVIGIATILVAVGIGSLFMINSVNKLNDKNTLQKQEGSNSNKDVLPNEIIKVIYSGEYDAYLLSADGKVYTGKLKESLLETGNIKEKFNFTQLNLGTTEKVADIAYAGEDLLFKLQNGEYYIMNDYIMTDKEIKVTEYRNAKRVMLDNIVDYAFEETMCGEYLFLEKNGDLYKLVLETNREINVEKIMSNVVKIEDYFRNAAIIDGDNNAYVIGYNVKEYGLLGESESTAYSKDRVCKPTKVAENVKEIDIFGWPLMHTLQVYFINQNNELYVVGHTSSTWPFMGDTNQLITTPMKVYDNVKHVHAMSNSTIIETLDGKIIEKDTSLLFEEDKEITNNYSKLILPGGFGGMMILKDKTLYGYGSKSDLDKFGLLQSTENYDYNGIIKLKDNVKKVFLSTDFNGAVSFIVTTDGKLYVSGHLTGGEFKEIIY